MHHVIPYPDDGSPLINELIIAIKASGDPKNWADFIKYTKKLAEYGLAMNTSFKRESFKRLEPDMYELRPPNFRIMFTVKDNKFYLLNGFFKKGQDTPTGEKNIARKHIKKIHNKQ